MIDESFDFLCTTYIQVLAAYVKSIEDHGYILHFGLPFFMGFLPKNSSAGKSQAPAVNLLLILSGMIEPSSICGFLCLSFLMQKAGVVK